MPPIVQIITLPALFGALAICVFGFDWMGPVMDGSVAGLVSPTPRYPGPMFFVLGLIFSYLVVMASHWFVEARKFFGWWLNTSALKTTLFATLGQAYLEWPKRDPAHKTESPFLTEIDFPERSPLDYAAAPQEWEFFMDFCEQIQVQIRGAAVNTKRTRKEAIQFNIARVKLSTRFYRLSDLIRRHLLFKKFNVKHALVTDHRLIRTLAYLEVATSIALGHKARGPELLESMRRIYVTR